jgi:acyl carrier protein
MKDKSAMKEELRTYIVSAFLPGESLADLKDDTPLRTSGLIDSMGLLRLVGFAENQYGIELQAYETSIENFDTIDAIADLIARKISGESKS